MSVVLGCHGLVVSPFWCWVFVSAFELPDTIMVVLDFSGGAFWFLVALIQVILVLGFLGNTFLFPACLLLTIRPGAFWFLVALLQVVLVLGFLVSTFLFPAGSLLTVLPLPYLEIF
jgi:hypothetical protein